MRAVRRLSLGRIIGVFHSPVVSFPASTFSNLSARAARIPERPATPSNPLRDLVRQAKTARQQQQQQQQPQPQPTPPQPASVTAPESDSPVSSDASDQPATALAVGKRPSPRYVSWRFHKFAAARDMQAAIKQLQTEGEQLFHNQQQQLKRQQQATLEQQQAEDKALKAAGKTPPPRKQHALREDKQPSALDSLSMHSPTVFHSLLRSFAAVGEVDGCYALLTTLYQLSMHNHGLEPWQDNTPQQQKAIHPHSSMKQRMEHARSQQHEVERHKQRERRRSPFTPNATTLAIIMLAYTYSPHRYDVTHHHQLFTHHSSLNVSPTPKFHHALLVYHDTHHTVHTYLASLSLLSRRHHPAADVYVRAIRHFGLNRADHDGALVLFLTMSSLFAPHAAAFNTMIAVFGEKGEWMLAALLMDDMRRQKQKLSAWTYAGIVRALLVGGKEAEGRAMYEYVRSTKRDEIVRDVGQLDDNMHRVMMDWARRHDDIDGIMRVWGEARADGAVLGRDTYTLMMQTLLAAGRVSTAREVVDELLRSNVEMSSTTYPAALQVLAATKDYEAARSLHSRFLLFMRRSELQVPRSVYVMLLSAVPEAEANMSVDKVVGVCRYCVSLLRDVCEEGGSGTPSGYVRMVSGLLRQYGAEVAANRLESEWVGKHNRSHSMELLDRLERDVTATQRTAT